MAGGGGYTPSGPGSGGGGYDSPSDPSGENPGEGGSEDGEDEDGNEIISFSTSASSNSIYTFESGRINLFFEPNNLKNQEVTYSVEKIGYQYAGQGNLLSINQDGTYIAGSVPGTERIKAVYKSNPSFYDTETIVIKRLLVEDIEINPKAPLVLEYKDNKPETKTVTATLKAGNVNSEYITNKTVDWKLTNNSDKKIKIDTNRTDGVTTTNRVTAIEPGVAGMIIESGDEGPTWKAYNVYVRGIKLKTNNIGVQDGGSLNLNDFIIALDTNGNSELEYSMGSMTSNGHETPIFATVSKDGQFKTNGLFSAEVIATLGYYSHELECEVTARTKDGVYEQKFIVYVEM